MMKQYNEDDDNDDEYYYYIFSGSIGRGRWMRKSPGPYILL